VQSRAALQRLHAAWRAFQMRVQDPYVSTRSSGDQASLNCSLIFCGQRRPNRGSKPDQDEQGNSRKGVKNARLRRIMTGSEVILTPESVDALQSLGAAAPAVPNSDGKLLPYFTNWELGYTDNLALIRTRDSRPLLAGGIPPGVDPWFLGNPSGLDPFSTLPNTDGEPIPKKSLIFHCKQS
jgi:hypothetical protein